MSVGRRETTRRLDETGAVAIMVALAMTSLVVVAAMVLDFGLVRVDRQVDQSAADSAALAGALGLGMNGSDTSHPFAGVCSALRYLRANSARFNGMPTSPSTGWSDGNGTAKGNGCDPATGLRNQSCVPGDPTTWARYVWDSTWQGTQLKVTIQSGYQLPATGWPEDGLPAAQSFSDDKAQGCDQIAVVILEKRQPGLGSVATTSQLTSSIRSVARVQSRPGSDAPAMLLLRRTGCPILQTGSNAGTSHVYVYGAMSSDGSSQAGTIHADSTGASCSGGSNQNIFLGKGTNGIVAFAAPMASSYSAYLACVQAANCPADPNKPGSISSVAAANGMPANVVSDGMNNVFGTGSASVSGIGSATKVAPTGRALVTRKLVDNRYLGSGTTTPRTGIAGIVANAAPVWSYTASSLPAGWSKFPAAVNACKPSQADVDALGLGPSSKLFVNCPSTPNGFVGPNSGTLSIPAGTIVFNGPVSPAATLSLPNATKVYIFGFSGSNKSAVQLSTGGTFSVHTTSTDNPAVSNVDTSTGLCSNSQTTSTNKALVVIKGGNFKQTGGTLRLCYTTVVMEGSGNNACLTNVPTEEANGPTSTPCTSGPGDGQLSQNGGDVDWTAPNALDLIPKDADGNALQPAIDAWYDVNGPEDLAFWSESYGGNSNPTYSMGGGSLLHVVGVYMLPNAEPFTINGGATQTLVNAQYIASSIDLNGTGTQISMRVDPNSAVTTPEQGLVGLVR